MNRFSMLWTIKLSDWQRALIIGVISGPFGIVYDSVMAWQFTFDWKAILRAAIIGFMSYIGKNFITGINGRLLTNAPVSLAVGQYNPNLYRPTIGGAPSPTASIPPAVKPEIKP